MHYTMLTQLLLQEPEEILSAMLQPDFQLKNRLCNRTFNNSIECVICMTNIFERILTCTAAKEKMSKIIQQIPGTAYIEGLYAFVCERDLITNQLNWNFCRSFLKMADGYFDLLPNSAIELTKIFERMELKILKDYSDTPVTT
jgi:hypothetical protein